MRQGHFHLPSVIGNFFFPPAVPHVRLLLSRLQVQSNSLIKMLQCQQHLRVITSNCYNWYIYQCKKCSEESTGELVGETLWRRNRTKNGAMQAGSQHEQCSLYYDSIPCPSSCAVPLSTQCKQSWVRLVLPLLYPVHCFKGYCYKWSWLRQYQSTTVEWFLYFIEWFQYYTYSHNAHTFSY